MIADVLPSGQHIAAWGLVLVANLTASARAVAHDLERTVVQLQLNADGTFVLDVANDPDWLLLRLERFGTESVGPAAPSDVSSVQATQRDIRLRALAPIFIDRIVLFVDGREVRPASAEYRPPSGDEPALAAYRLRGRFDPDARGVRWYYGLVVDPYPLTIRHADGSTFTEWIAGDGWSTELGLGPFASPDRWRVATRYLRLGYLHILPRGLDHVLFVLGLFLLNVRWRPILMQVSAFTAAHTMTLGLTTYGVLSLSARVVEPLIAVSIAYVALENLVSRRLHPWRLALVAMFGLLHGMGFAGVLSGLDLPRSEFTLALLSFNVGVEGGQLTVIAIAGLCVVWFRGRPWYHARVVVPASLAIAAAGACWALIRLYGA